MRNRRLTESENLHLPVPRLEIRYRRLPTSQEYDLVADYSLVYQHLLGEVMMVSLGKTLVGGSHTLDPEYLEMPFRAGADMLSDMEHLRLPGYVINGKNFKAVTLEPDSYPGALHARLKSQGRKWKKERKR